jgi:uncharacterized protein (DUF1778 family)
MRRTKGRGMSTDTKQGERRVMVSARFTPAQVEMLERVAQVEDRTVSDLIRRAVSMYLFDATQREQRR